MSAPQRRPTNGPRRSRGVLSCSSPRVGDRRGHRCCCRTSRQRKAEAQARRSRSSTLDRGHGRPGGVGQELPAPVRQLQPHGRHRAHPLRRQRGRSSTLDERPAPGRAHLRRLRLRASTTARSAATPTCCSDQHETERVTQFKQPGACLHCHASTIMAYREAGLEHGAPARSRSRSTADGRRSS